MSPQSKQATIDRRLIKALGHPVRVRALEILNERVASPSELAKELAEPLGNVAYHVKILEENDAIELVRTAPVRGALEHFYRARIQPWFSALELDDEAYEEVVSLLDGVVKRAQELQKKTGSRTAKPSARGEGDHSTALMIMHIERAGGGRPR
jgi:DNA-binding transcriptional ArsR family regulator